MRLRWKYALVTFFWEFLGLLIGQNNPPHQKCWSNRRICIIFIIILLQKVTVTSVMQIIFFKNVNGSSALME